MKALTIACAGRRLSGIAGRCVVVEAGKTAADDVCDMCVHGQFLPPAVSLIKGGPKFTLRGLAPPGRHLAEKVLYPKPVLVFL